MAKSSKILEWHSPTSQRYATSGLAGNDVDSDLQRQGWLSSTKAGMINGTVRWLSNSLQQAVFKDLSESHVFTQAALCMEMQIGDPSVLNPLNSSAFTNSSGRKRKTTQLKHQTLSTRQHQQSTDLHDDGLSCKHWLHMMNHGQPGNVGLLSESSVFRQVGSFDQNPKQLLSDIFKQEEKINRQLSVQQEK